MYRRVMLTVLAAVVLICAGSIAADQTTALQQAPTKYKVNITVSIEQPAGQPRVVRLPVATVRQGASETLKFKIGNDSFHFKAVVKPNQDQVLVAKTTGRLEIAGQKLATPGIEQKIGQVAKIKTPGVGIRIDYTPVAD